MSRELVITDPELRIGLEKENLVLYRGTQATRKSKLQDLEQVVIMGAADLTGAARNALLRRQIEVVFISMDGKYLGRLTPPGLGNGAVRLAQYRFCSQPEQALAVARNLIQGKLENQRRLLLRQQRELQSEAVAESLAGIRVVAGKVSSSTALDQLMGYEGRAAALYFAAFPHLIRRPGFPMQGRSKRPPRDAPNALLSFGYTALLAQMETQVLQAGLDPYLGCLHQLRSGMPSLALDLLEEFRPVLVDNVILRLLNRGQIRPEDFYQPTEAKRAEAILLADEDSEPEPPDPRPAVYMARTGHQIFFKAFYQRLRDTLDYPPLGKQLSIKDILLQQVWHMGRVMQGAEPVYVPFCPR